MNKSLVQEINNFRKLLDEIKLQLTNIGYPFEDFPKGCCEYSINFLAQYLVTSNICDKNEMSFPYNNISDDFIGSHNYIKFNNGINVDITADQFPNINDKVIIEEAHSVHKSFEKYPIQEWVDYNEFTKRATDERFAEAWEIIQKKLKEV